MIKKSLCGLTSDEIFHIIGSSGFTAGHAVAVSDNIYKKRIIGISDFKKIPGKLKETLAPDYCSGIVSPVLSEISEDKTIKYLFRTDTGKEFETVFIPDNKRNTVCVSTQSGCRMGCVFCVTGKYGYKGNLSAGEIVNQVLGIPDSRNVTHVVFMGMGEPMDNLDNVIKACRIFTAEWGMAISSRNITVSTVGITRGVEKFLNDSSCNLTLSLHSPYSKERELFIPMEKVYPFHDTLEIMKRHQLRKKRRLSLAYVMIKNINDSDKHLEELKILLADSDIRVNLIPYNTVSKDIFSASSEDRMQYFKHSLVVSGISASIRKSRGTDISAACGLLATGLK